MDQVQFLLGRLVERSEHTSSVVARIEHRQIWIAGEVSAMRERVRKLEDGSPKPPAAELWIKRLVTVAAPAGTLWATGSAEKAVEVLRALLH